MPSTTYYALLNPKLVRREIDVVVHGDDQYVDGDKNRALYVAGQARQAPVAFQDELDLHGDLLDLLAMGNCLARLTPRGEVTATNGTPALYICAAGWRVTGWESPDAFLGPQARHIRNLLTKFADIDGPAEDRYDTAIDAQYNGSGWTAQKHVDAARAALEREGADGIFWGELAAPCNMGGELIALAARDLIGTVRGWTWDAYATLVEPWRAAFGEGPHPQDKFRIAR